MISRVCLLLVVLGLAGCAAGPPPLAVDIIPNEDPFYTPERVEPGRLEYAPDRTTFAPILTERVPYPTQVEANDAYRRLIAGTAGLPGAAGSVWLFGCKPGALDPLTGRIVKVRGAVVHCAADVLDGTGRRRDRETVNFAYDGAVWVMHPVDPPRTPVPWRNREGSPKDPWSWVPGRDRYE